MTEPNVSFPFLCGFFFVLCFLFSMAVLRYSSFPEILPSGPFSHNETHIPQTPYLLSVTIAQGQEKKQGKRIRGKRKLVQSYLRRGALAVLHSSWKHLQLC